MLLDLDVCQLAHGVCELTRRARLQNAGMIKRAFVGAALVVASGVSAKAAPGSSSRR
jgi:hypothetical protein